MLKRVVFLSFVFFLYTLTIINAQENVESKQFIYKGDTIAIHAISLYDIPDVDMQQKIGRLVKYHAAILCLLLR